MYNAHWDKRSGTCSFRHEHHITCFRMQISSHVAPFPRVRPVMRAATRAVTRVAGYDWSELCAKPLNSLAKMWTLPKDGRGNMFNTWWITSKKCDCSISCAKVLYEPMKTHAWLVDYAKNVSASMANNVDELWLVDFVCDNLIRTNENARKTCRLCERMWVQALWTTSMKCYWSISSAKILFERMKTHRWQVNYVKMWVQALWTTSRNCDWSISSAIILYEWMKKHAWLVDFSKNVSAGMVNNDDEAWLVDFFCENVARSNQNAHTTGRLCEEMRVNSCLSQGNQRVL